MRNEKFSFSIFAFCAKNVRTAKNELEKIENKASIRPVAKPLYFQQLKAAWKPCCF